MANEDIRTTWADTAIGWVEHEATFDATFAPITEAVLGAAAIGPGQRVLDVGCGTGTLLAAAAAAGAEPVGVDLSPAMAQAARLRVPSAVVLLADVQTTDLLAAAPGRPFDRVVSRFGVMFFDEPGTAFAGIRAASATGAGLAFACWRTYEENPTFSLGQDVLLARLDEEPAQAVPFAPGPTAFADPGHVRTVLAEAGWDDVAISPLDVTLDYGYDGSDGVENRLALILATTTGRRARAGLEPALGPDGWAALLDDIRARLRGSLTDGVLQLPAGCWLVTARA